MTFFFQTDGDLVTKLALAEKRGDIYVIAHDFSCQITMFSPWFSHLTMFFPFVDMRKKFHYWLDLNFTSHTKYFLNKIKMRFFVWSCPWHKRGFWNQKLLMYCKQILLKLQTWMLPFDNLFLKSWWCILGTKLTSFENRGDMSFLSNHYSQLLKLSFNIFLTWENWFFW